MLLALRLLLPLLLLLLLLRVLQASCVAAVFIVFSVRFFNSLQKSFFSLRLLSLARASQRGKLKILS